MEKQESNILRHALILWYLKNGERNHKKPDLNRILDAIERMGYRNRKEKGVAIRNKLGAM